MNKALFAGSFDPLTCGHLDLIRRSSKLCDELVVGVICNPSKMPLFNIEERTAMIREVTADIPNVRVDAFTISWCGGCGAVRISNMRFRWRR